SQTLPRPIDSATLMSHAYEFGEFLLNPAERTLVRHGQAIALTPKVFDTLVLLVENAGRLITKDEFMKRVWAEAFVEDAALAQSFSQLRKGLGDSQLIETVSKKGYRFLGEVKRVDVDALPGTVAPKAVPVEIKSQDSTGADNHSHTGKKGHRWVW